MWADAVWKTPEGREIHCVDPDECHEAVIELSDGTERCTHWAGAPASGVKVDGKRWTPSRDVDWDDRCATD